MLTNKEPILENVFGKTDESTQNGKKDFDVLIGALVTSLLFN